MGKFIDLTGLRFGLLTVVGRASTNTKSGKPRWNCNCDCGNETVVNGKFLRGGTTKSCGCFNKTSHTIHGHAANKQSTPEYRTWSSMIGRCYYPCVNGYENYGGRGIQVCQQWRESFEQFLSDMGPRPSLNHSIDRKDVNLDYTPENCHWATLETQSRNKRLDERNKTGCSDVSIAPSGNFVSRIRVNGERIYLGTFSILEDAIAARKKAEEKYWGKTHPKL